MDKLIINTASNFVNKTELNYDKTYAETYNNYLFMSGFI